jgi:hypothetical protein
MAEKFSASISGEMSPEDAVSALQQEMTSLVKQGEQAAG